ncbi:hypothetical protein DKL51_14210 [Micromonospora globispora]|nr:hypothetical protein DKL51_14210 [Micromonospora globispora]
MTTSGTNGLLRKLEDVARASFLELFFDVVFVFALRALAQQLLNNLTWSGAFQALVLLLAIGWVWSLTARVTEQLNPRRPPVQLLVLATMVGALVLSAAVPEAFGKTGLIFAVTYLAIQIGRSLVLVLLLRGQELQHIARRGRSGTPPPRCPGWPGRSPQAQHVRRCGHSRLSSSTPHDGSATPCQDSGAWPVGTCRPAASTWPTATGHCSSSPSAK